MQYVSIPVTHYQQNCSIAWCPQTKEAILVDPGGNADTLLGAIKKLGLNLIKIVLTHGHFDHVGATSEIADSMDVPIEGPHKGDLFWIDDLDYQAQRMGFTPVKSFTPSRWLNDGDTVHFGEQTLEVIHTPGHTPGHVVLFHRETEHAFVGDVIFQGSIGRTDFPRSDSQALIDAIRTKLWPLGDNVSFTPGHGPESTFGEERKHNAFVADHRFG